MCVCVCVFACVCVCETNLYWGITIVRHAKMPILLFLVMPVQMCDYAMNLLHMTAYIYVSPLPT